MRCTVFIFLPLFLIASSNSQAQEESLILDDVPVPPGNPITEAKRILGKILFWEEQLSSDNSVACGTCHKPAAGGADSRVSRHPGPDLAFDTGNETFGSPGLPLYNTSRTPQKHPNFGYAPQVTRRAAQSVLTAMYSNALFWDGRARDQLVDPLTQEVVLDNNAALESQALVPILSATEMGHINRKWSQVTTKLSQVKPLTLASELPADMANALHGGMLYPALFAQAFGSDDITPVRIVMAIATYERTLLPDQSPFDQYVQGNTTAMTPDQVAGWALFQNSVCSQCHVPPLFTNNGFARTGLRTRFDDNGLQVFTKNTADFALFKTPSLRNVGLRQSLTHVGWITDVQDAIDFYNSATNDTRHTMFTDGLSSVPDPDNPDVSIRIDEFDFLGDQPDKQALVVDFLSNALTDPRAANETYPFDRPRLGSEARTLTMASSDQALLSSQVSTRVLINGLLSRDAVFSAGDTLFINQSITIEPGDRGKPGDLFVVIAAGGKNFQRNSTGKFVPWNGKVRDLQAMAQRTTLGGTENISVVESLTGLPGTFSIYSAYSTGERIIFSATPFRLVIE